MDLYRKSKKVLNSQQLQALKDVYAWRDKMARSEDESIGSVSYLISGLTSCWSLERRAQLNSLVAPSDFCMEPKDALVSIHSTFR